MSTTKKSFGFQSLYRILTVVLSIIFFVTGIGNIIPFGHIANDMALLGYPAYFMKFLGGWKIIGGLIIILPVSDKLRFCAYAGMTIDLTGALYSRFAIHDAAVTKIIPLIILFLVIVSWSLLSGKNKIQNIS